VLVRVYVNQQATAVEEGVATRFTLPEKPFTLSTSMIVCLSEAKGMICELGFSEIVNSEDETDRVTVVEWLRLPLVPEIVMV